MRNQTSFRLTTTLLPTDTSAKTTDVINKVDSCGCKFKPDFTEETVVLTNDDRTIMETTRAYSCNGALCFTKRGLSDDNTETEIANRKLTWNPWTLAFVTAWAWDRIDPDDNITWTGTQTYTGNLVSCGCATYNWILDTKKWVKYPNFANTTCLNAYANPYGWMFATVDDTWELYRYNAVTCCWDMVSSVALGTYEIRCCATAPSPWTANTVVTIAEPLKQIYLWENLVADGAYYADALIVWGWGGWNNAAWGWAWAVIYREMTPLRAENCVIVWAWWAEWCLWCKSSLWWIKADWGWVWNTAYPATCNWSAWGWSYWNGHWTYWNNWSPAWTEWSYTTCTGCWAWWWAWWEWWWPSQWGQGWWIWKKIEFSNWTSAYYAYGWWGASRFDCYNCSQYSHCWWGATCNYCGSGWWGWWLCDCWTCWWKAWKDWVVVVMYPTDWSYWIHCATWGTVTTCNWYTVHTFTSDWTFCVVN